MHSIVQTKPCNQDLASRVPRRLHFAENLGTVEMLEEIISGFFSLFAALTLDSPRVVREVSANHDVTDDSRLLENSVARDNRVQREYEEDSVSKTINFVHLGYERRVKPTYTQSLLRSLKATLSLSIATFPIILISMTVLYFDLRTTHLCSGNLARNDTPSFDVVKIRLIGAGIEVMMLNLWFPYSLIILFGWSEFKCHYAGTILVGLLAGLLYVLYLSFLLLYGVYDTKLWLRIPGNVTYAIGLIWGCVLVDCKIRKNRPMVSYSAHHIRTILAVPVLFSFAMAMFYRYAAASWFNSLHSTLYKFLVAVSTPTLAIVPTAVCRHLALRRSSEIVEPERSFVLVYYVRAGWIALYRIVQADLKDISSFVGLSLLSGFAILLKTGTVRFRERFWARIIRLINKTGCIRLTQLPSNTPHHRRLKADCEIQNMLFECTSIALGQAYNTMYMLTSFVLSDWLVVKKSLIRIAIGLSIEFSFNFFNIFVLIHYYNIPIGRVWSKYWKRHVYANIVITAVVVSYFTGVLLAIFQNRIDETSTENVLRNCTLPYESWR